MMGSKLFNVTCDRTLPGGMCTVGYDDDGVKSQQWPMVREGMLVGSADQPRDRALHRPELLARLHVRHVVAQLSVPAHAERPRRAGPAGIADAGTRSSPTPRTAC